MSGFAELSLKDGESIAMIGDLHGDTQQPSSRIDNYMETMSSKMLDILEKCISGNVKATFWSGDIFNRIQLPSECVNRVGSIFIKFKEKGIRVFSIYGNHDMCRNTADEGVYTKSPLTILFNFGVIEHVNLSNSIVINKKTLITAVDYAEVVPIANKVAKYNILFAHVFYNAGDIMADEKHNIKPSDIDELGYDGMMLGHDHTDYETMSVGKKGTVIIRPGSVMRATCHDTNFIRVPHFYIIKNPGEFSKSGVEKVLIKARPFRDVVSTMVLNRKENTLSGIRNIMSDLINQLTSGDNEDYDGVVDRIKKEKELPDEVRRVILDYFGRDGIC